MLLQAGCCRHRTRPHRCLSAILQANLGEALTYRCAHFTTSRSEYTTSVRTRKPVVQAFTTAPWQRMRWLATPELLILERGVQAESCRTPYRRNSQKFVCDCANHTQSTRVLIHTRASTKRFPPNALAPVFGMGGGWSVSVGHRGFYSFALPSQPRV